jgi:hypothetical protein
MKNSQYIGVGLILALVFLAWQPWIYVSSVDTYVRGMDPGKTAFGKPALFNLFCCAPSLVFFLIPRIWAKRANVFFTTINFAWALKNFILLSICRQGECPVRYFALYGMLACAGGILLMSLLPRMKLPTPKKETTP